MKIYISTFYNLRYLKDSQVPISVCASDPWFFHSKTNKYCHSEGYYINDNNVLFGIREESLSPLNLKEEDCICANCDHSLAPNCRFMNAYAEYIKTIDFKALVVEFERVAEEVRKVTNFKGEPEIVLLVYEAITTPCSERYSLKDLFKSNGLELIEFTKETNNEQIF